jgi:hypothetical protein
MSALQTRDRTLSLPLRCTSDSADRATVFRRVSSRADGRPERCTPSILARSGPSKVSLRSRVAFWAKIHDRLAALGNRIGADEHAKILGALHGRIPMVTPENIRAVQEESFADDERFWDTMRDMNASHIEGLKGHIALAESKIAAIGAGGREGRREGRGRPGQAGEAQARRGGRRRAQEAAD